VRDSSGGGDHADVEVVSRIAAPTSAGPDAAQPARDPLPENTPVPAGAGTPGAIAPSSPMAVAARAFGDDFPPISRHWLVRAAGIAYLASAVIYVPWLLTVLNRHLPWLCWPFLAANA
jgi:hypothetical protein